MCRPKFYQSILNFEELSRKMRREQFIKMANRKLKYINKNFRKLKKWRHMGLQMKSELSADFGLHKVMDVQLFDMEFEKYQ